MIPVPRAWLLTSAMLVGAAVGMLVGIAVTVLVERPVRPDLVIGLVVGIPTALGLLLVLVSGRRWVTALGAFVLALTPGWFGALAAIEVVRGG
ncbi:putative holin [Mycobacterium sp. pUA109]|uniref:putative holin n=1 Tax=Mycobacterium sp. pUA109 TaxID=3238982 RepID=UPI00351BE9B1